MKIFMACPAPPRSRKGNRVTAVRWAGILKQLGHRLRIGQEYDGRPADLMVALHARKSHPAMRRWRAAQPGKPLVLCLTGTDLYRDIRTNRRARQSLEWADRLVLLQACGLHELTPKLRRKAVVIHQSAEAVSGKILRRAPTGRFEAVVLGHLRSEKDPFRAALALCRLPPELPLRVTHLGAALSEAMARSARKLMALEPRYRWLGEVPRGRALRMLAGSQLLVLSSRMEGGANVISEALVNNVPVLASRIPGSVGLLGAKYPGYFPVGNTEVLANLLRRAATEKSYYDRLRTACLERKPLFEPEWERTAWQALLAELGDD